jgi:hypothetical protein
MQIVAPTHRDYRYFSVFPLVSFVTAKVRPGLLSGVAGPAPGAE